MGLSPTFTFVCRVQNPPFSEEGGKNHSESEHSLAKMFITLWGKMHDSHFTKKLSVLRWRLEIPRFCFIWMHTAKLFYSPLFEKTKVGTVSFKKFSRYKLNTL